jgi:hypothetical protein
LLLFPRSKKVPHFCPAAGALFPLPSTSKTKPGKQAAWPCLHSKMFSNSYVPMGMPMAQPPSSTQMLLDALDRSGKHLEQLGAEHLVVWGKTGR